MKNSTIVVMASIVLLVLVAGCGTQQASTGSNAASSGQSDQAAASAQQNTPSAAGNVNTDSKQFSQDIVNCVKGTPWTYTGASAAGGYSVTYTIDGKTQYKGAEYCKVIGKVEGAGLPAGYSWEYYFRWDQAKANYADVCYKISYPGAPTQEGCTNTAAS